MADLLEGDIHKGGRKGVAGVVPREKQKRCERKGGRSPRNTALLHRAEGTSSLLPRRRKGRAQVTSALGRPWAALGQTLLFTWLLSVGPFSSGQTFLAPNDSVLPSSSLSTHGTGYSLSRDEVPPAVVGYSLRSESEHPDRANSKFLTGDFALKPPENLAEAPSGRRSGPESETRNGQASPNESNVRIPAAPHSADIPLQRRASPRYDARSMSGGGGQALPWLTIFGALGMVIGAFFLFAWAMRRMNPHHITLLPREAVEVLGQAPLSARHRLCLIRIGRKLVLVAINTDGIETLTEIDDPAEVDHLVGVVATQRFDSSTQTFKNLFTHYLGRDQDQSS